MTDATSPETACRVCGRSLSGLPPEFHEVCPDCAPTGLDGAARDLEAGAVSVEPTLAPRDGEVETLAGDSLRDSGGSGSPGSRSAVESGATDPGTGSRRGTAPAPARFDPSEDPGFASRYQVIEVLGQGAMGIVYRGVHKVLQREVAIKLMISMSEDERRRFAREGLVGARLDHANLVQVLDAGEVSGCPYLVMELVGGASLQQHIEDRGGRLPVEEAVGIMDQFLDGLGYLHGRGIVHRDLKPANLFLTTGGVVKIGDFGIAWQEASMQLTGTSEMMGTPPYMAPEQFRGPVHEPTADIYSAGIILHRMLSGSLPFNESTLLGYYEAHAKRPPPPLRNLDASLPPHLEAAVRMALEKNPVNRPRTARHFKSLLHPGEAAVRPGDAGTLSPGARSPDPLPVPAEPGTRPASPGPAVATVVSGGALAGPVPDTVKVHGPRALSGAEGDVMALSPGVRSAGLMEVLATILLFVLLLATGAAYHRRLERIPPWPGPVKDVAPPPEGFRP